MSQRILKIIFLAMGLFLIATLPASATSTPPSIDSESATGISPNSATLEALINPQSTEQGAYYQFQLAEDPSEFAPEFTCPTEGFPAHSSLCLGITAEEGALPIEATSAGTTDQAVNLDLESVGASLEPGTTYYYRVIAARIAPSEDTIDWEEPTVFGESKSFATSSGAPPTIETQSVSNLTSSDATLEATINPGGLETTYEFLLWESACGPECESIVDIPLPSATLPASSAGEEVSLDLNSAGVTLNPGAEYGYSVTASNGVGNDESEPEIFYAPTEGAPTIVSESATAITPSDATLNAEIDPRGEETTYRFQIDTTGHFKFDQEDSCLLHPPGIVCAQEVIAGEPLPAGLLEPPEQSLPAVEGPQKVSVDLNAIGATLQPSTTYYFRVIATHDDGRIVKGGTETFTTPAEEEKPAEEGSSSGAGGCSPGTCPGTNPGQGQSGPPSVTTCKKGQIKRHGVCVKKPRPCKRKGHHAKHCHRNGRPRFSPRPAGF